jgi:hypothetical protein
MKLNMKLLPVLGLMLSVVSAQATILIQDNFPVNGDLVGTTPSVGGTWGNISGAAGTLDVVSNQLVINNGSGEDAGSQFASAQTGVIYAGFDFTLTTPPTTATGGYIASFRDGTLASGTYTGRFFAMRTVGSPANEFQIGVSNTSASPNATFGVNLTINTTYRVVMAFDTATDDTTLWLNPTTIASSNVTATDALTVTNLDGFAFRQDSASHGAARIDNFVVATTFAEAVPEPTSAGMVVSAMLVMAFRRRKSKNLH